MAYVGIDGGANPFIPTMSPLTGNVQVMISRNRNSFATEQYARQLPVDLPTGHYLRIDTDEQVRMVAGSENEWVWPLGNPAPNPHNISFDLTPTYNCVRYAPSWQFPLETAQRAVWDLHATNTQQRVVTAMTIRAIKAARALADASSWADSGTQFAKIADLGAAGGVTITGNYTTEGNIRKFFRAAANVVKMYSAGAVNPKSDLIAVMNPNTAGNLMDTTELTKYILNTPFAPSYMDGSGYANNWVLPASMFNVANIVIEDAVMTTSERGASSTTRSYVLPDHKVIFVSKPAGLMENVGSNFATLTAFMCAPNNLTVETWVDPENRLHKGRVIDEVDYQVTAPRTGVYVDINAT